MPTSAPRRARPAGAAARPRHTAAVLDELRRIVRALRVAAGRGESATGLTAAQLFVLQAVRAEPGCSLTELAARTMTDRTSVAAVVDRLVERGLVARRPSATDRRRTEVVPTRAAASVAARAPHAPTHLVLDALDALDDATLARLAGALGALVAAMGLADTPAPMLFEDPPARRRAR